jgi:hypothetical protein
MGDENIPSWKDFVCGLFNDAVNSSYNTASNDTMINELLSWRKLSWRNLRYYPGIWLEGLEENTIHPSKDSRFVGDDFNPESRVRSRTCGWWERREADKDTKKIRESKGVRDDDTEEIIPTECQGHCYIITCYFLGSRLNCRIRTKWMEIIWTM